jgi:DNA-binding transcriptional MocR family regulator
VETTLQRVGTRTEAVMDTIRQRIERRSLVPGARIPSVRAMADTTGFSKATVVEAYDRLVAEGVIRSRPGAGYFVAAPLAPLSLSHMGPPLAREVDPLWMLRHSLTAAPDALRPGAGWLPDEWMGVDSIRKGLRQLARGATAATLVGYETAAGSEPLRRLIARRLAEQNVEASPDQILLTDSGTHAIDMALRFLVQPGDAVLVDDPYYFNTLALLRAHRVRIVGVPRTPTGPDMQAFELAVRDHAPRVYVTNSALHNPTGGTLSASTAHRIMKLVDAHDMVVIEDDIFGDFEHEPSARLAAFDGLERVVRVGSFSKSLSMAVRCGHIAARPDWIAGMTDLRISTGLSGNALSAELLLTVLSDGSYRRHMDQVRARLSRSMASLLTRLRSVGLEPWLEPSAGLFAWCRLPNGLDAADVTRQGVAENIIFAPGDVFSVTQTANSYLRFNAALSDDDRIIRFLERVCR